MNNYLFFRTDRIGDFLMSAVLIKSIKKNDKKSHITVIASRKNFFYIKTLDFIDEVFLYPENFIKKIFFFLKLRKKSYNLISTLDGKKRSIYFSIFLKSKKKVLMTTKIFYKKVLKRFFSKIYFFDQSLSKIEEIKDVLNLCEMKFDKSDIIFLKNQKIQHNKAKLIENYINFHFDEKWIYDHYIKKYQSIEPNIENFKSFVEKLIYKTDKNIVITTGLINNNLIDTYLSSFKKINENIYEKDFNNKIIQVYLKINFFDLKYLIKNSNFIITCHGASTHLASALDIKIYDIFDKSQKEFYNKWNNHMQNYNFFYRENFSDLSNKILNKL
tara:strand:+ start:2147 stop:3133 length:987 start_codon:yes stop_codon:yes gene_type:complete